MLDELLELPNELWLERCDELGEFDDCEDDEEGSAGVAESTSAEKLSVNCEGSGRLAFGAALWKAVLAGMSDETLNTLEAPDRIRALPRWSSSTSRMLIARTGFWSSASVRRSKPPKLSMLTA